MLRNRNDESLCSEPIFRDLQQLPHCANPESSETLPSYFTGAGGAAGASPVGGTELRRPRSGGAAPEVVLGALRQKDGGYSGASRGSCVSARPGPAVGTLDAVRLALPPRARSSAAYSELPGCSFSNVDAFHMVC
jgi:hypothetical protein